jgi:hypothetical protein
LTLTFAPHQSGSTLKIRADMFAAKERPGRRESALILR